MYLFSLPQLECKFYRLWIWLRSTYNRFRNSAWGRPLVFFLSVRSIDVYTLADIRNDWQGLEWIAHPPVTSKLQKPSEAEAQAGD